MNSEKVAEIIYRGDKKIHGVRPGEQILVFIHQTHPYKEGEPQTKSFNVEVFPCPKEVSIRDELLAKLFRRKSNLSGYCRVLIAEPLD